LAAIYDWEVHQVDVKNVYLNATLTENVYMAQPPGFVQAGKTEKVCKLHKALYGLKQAGCKWYNALYTTITDLGSHVTAADPRVFITRI